MGLALVTASTRGALKSGQNCPRQTHAKRTVNTSCGARTPISGRSDPDNRLTGTLLTWQEPGPPPWKRWVRALGGSPRRGGAPTLRDRRRCARRRPERAPAHGAGGEHRRVAPGRERQRLASGGASVGAWRPGARVNAWHPGASVSAWRGRPSGRAPSGPAPPCGSAPSPASPRRIRRRGRTPGTARARASAAGPGTRSHPRWRTACW